MKDFLPSHGFALYVPKAKEVMILMFECPGLGDDSLPSQPAGGTSITQVFPYWLGGYLPLATGARLGHI